MRRTILYCSRVAVGPNRETEPLLRHILGIEVYLAPRLAGVGVVPRDVFYGPLSELVTIYSLGAHDKTCISYALASETAAPTSIRHGKVSFLARCAFNA